MAHLSATKIACIMLLLLCMAHPALAWGDEGNESPICTEPGEQMYPAISGDRIVWQDHRNDTGGDIYLYDLTTEEETPICTDPAAQGYPAISGSLIVWQDMRNGSWDIYLYNLDTDDEVRLTNSTGDQYMPAISGEKIVWYDNRSGSPQMYLYDYATGTETLIEGSHPETWYRPAISGNRIVWQDNRNGPYNIFLYDIATGSGEWITDDLNLQSSPAISGNRIVWEDDRDEVWNIHLYDLAAGTRTLISNHSEMQVSPAISGDRIVWEDKRTGTMDIYLYNLATDRETPICTAPGRQLFPAISGDRIVWQDLRDVNWDIYMFTITGSSLPKAEFDARPLIGNAPLTVRFTDQSDMDVGEWSWEFGDGKTSSEQNPEHTYLEAGNYTVSMTISSAAGNDTVAKPDYIRVKETSVRPVAGFEAEITSGPTPLTVRFSDTSAGSPTEWLWEFGDGGTSTDRHPVYQYTNAGVYDVALTVWSDAG
ncbi:MAG: PKD domain-containing protein, partial [Methanomicrobiaceae archaeon]|nr:PKD domain-containing protein [Methanomicrobiaceae archaeon]